jgi:FHA domain
LPGAGNQVGELGHASRAAGAGTTWATPWPPVWTEPSLRVRLAFEGGFWGEQSMLLVFTSGHRGRQAVDIDRARITIGRVAENDVQLVDDKVSRHHAVIELQDGGRVVLHDLGSRNGTFVDGVRLTGSRVLAGGEQLRFGDEQLRVEGSAPGQAAVEAERPDRSAAEARRPSVRRVLPGRIGRRGLVVGIVALAAVAVIGVAQLVLPGVAEQKLRSDLARYGTIRRVHVESSPAIKLLWHRADRVVVAMGSYHSKPSGHGSLADFLSRTRDTGKLDVSVGTLQTRLVTLHDVRLHKEGDVLVGQARLTQPDLSAALPGFVDLHPVSASENGIVVQASASVLGHRVATRIAVLADSGRLVVRPEGLPFGSLATITVFGDPRVYVESLGAELRGENYFLTARALLR